MDTERMPMRATDGRTASGTLNICENIAKGAGMRYDPQGQYVWLNCFLRY